MAERELILKFMEEFKTRKLGAAVIHIPNDIAARLEVLVGSADRISNRPSQVFSADRVEFLSELSKALFLLPDVRQMPDLSTFAYWCRKSNIVRLGNEYVEKNAFRTGMGLSFHICPSNVPVNCAFTLAFGLLSGNTCVLRLPSKHSDVVDVLIVNLLKVLEQKKFAHLKREILIARFDRDDVINAFWVSVADCKIIWGGDDTVNNFRQMPSRPRSREIAFPDRYSFCMLNPDSIVGLARAELRSLCLNLYNDIYLMDQAACSSPQLVAWIGEASTVKQAKSRLWDTFAEVVSEHYDLKPVNAVDKYVNACRIAIDNKRVDRIERHGNYLYRVELASVSEEQESCRGYFGTVYEATLDSFIDLVPVVSERYQTVTYFGFSPGDIKEFVAFNRLRGIDRIVPVGKAIDMGLLWDGYDVISTLSREVVIQ